MRLNKSLDLSTRQEHIPRALVDLSTFDYIQLFINIIIKSGVLFKAFVLLKIQSYVTFGCSNYGKYSLYIKHANISILNLN